MKKIILMTAVLVLGVNAAMADEFFGAPAGILYNDTVVPFSKYFDSSVQPLKKGEATCKNYFFLIAKGKCGINDAMNNGRITKIHSIDKQNKNILLYQKSKIVVYGE